MARTQSQKIRRAAKREAQAKAKANASRQLKASLKREAVEIELTRAKSLKRATYLQTIKNGAESKVVQRERIHAKKVTYTHRINAAGEVVTTKHTKLNNIPLARLSTASRLDVKKRHAARLLLTHKKYAARIGLSSADLLHKFVTAYPSDAYLLGLTNEACTVHASPAKLEKLINKFN